MPLLDEEDAYVTTPAKGVQADTHSVCDLIRYTDASFTRPLALCFPIQFSLFRVAMAPGGRYSW